MLATGVQFSTVHQNAQHRFMLWRDGLRCHGSIYEVGLRTPLKPQLEFSAREHSTNFASLAQSGEHYTVTVEVRGSKPLRGAKQYIPGVNGSMTVSKTAGGGSNPSGYAKSLCTVRLSG